jgi:hypothetical protein
MKMSLPERYATAGRWEHALTSNRTDSGSAGGRTDVVSTVPAAGAPTKNVNEDRWLVKLTLSVHVR